MVKIATFAKSEPVIGHLLANDMDNLEWKNLFETDHKIEYWYQLLNCLPYSSDSFEYKRLKRIWSDQTRFRGKKGTSNRQHILFNLRSEQNLQISIWENFTIFDKSKFIYELNKIVKFDFDLNEVQNVNWSYEWEKPIIIEGYRIGIKLLDIVIKITTISEEFLIIVECKNLHNILSSKDINPKYYLDIEEFNRFGNNKGILFCVGSKVENKVKSQIDTLFNHSRIVTWESIANIQLALVNTLEIDTTIKRFIIYSFLSQYESKGIHPQMQIQEFKMDDDLNHFLQLDYCDILNLKIPNAIKGFICGSMLNQFHSIKRDSLPFEYLKTELKQSEMDTSEFQPRSEREYALWDN